MQHDFCGICTFYFILCVIVCFCDEGDSGCTEDAGQNGTLVDDKLDSAEEASLDITVSSF